MRTEKWTLPESCNFGWAPRKVEDTETSMTKVRGGRFEITIRHNVLRGITIDMLAWWFQHLDESREYRGAIYPCYHIWHEHDHIKVMLTRGEDGLHRRQSMLDQVLARRRQEDLQLPMRHGSYLSDAPTQRN